MGTHPIFESDFDCLTEVSKMIHSVMIFNRQGRTRLEKWYTATSQKQKSKVVRNLTEMIPRRPSRFSNIIEMSDIKVVYKRYASLFFVLVIDTNENELDCLNIIHTIVELFDKHFNNVCELDIVFEFQQAYHILDEFILGGYIQESSQAEVLFPVEEGPEVHQHQEVMERLQEFGLV